MSDTLQALSLGGLVLMSLLLCVSWIDTVVASKRLQVATRAQLRRSRLKLGAVMAIYLTLVVSFLIATPFFNADAYT